MRFNLTELSLILKHNRVNGELFRRFKRLGRRGSRTKTKSGAVLVLALAFIVQSFVFTATNPVAARGTQSQQENQAAGTSLIGTPVQPVASAIVNFTQLAEQEASRPPFTGPRVPQLIHSPVTPPEGEAPTGETSLQKPSQSEKTAFPNSASPPPASSFIGMTDIPKVGSGFIVIPPDTTGAVGLTQIFTTVNNNYVVQNKTTGALSPAVSMDTFWAGIGATGPFDPRTVYDPYNDRWIVSAVSDAVTANSSILVGVSQTGNPGGTYFLFRIDYDSTNTNWADFPVMGFNKNWVAININSIPQPGPLIPNKTLVLDYPQLRAGVMAAMTFSGTNTCAYPATTYSSTENTLYITSHLSSGGANYELDTITGAPAVPTYNFGAIQTRPGGGWTQPPPGGQILPQSAPVAGASVCGATPCLLETTDAFVRSEPVFRNGNIYYAQTIGLPSGGTLTRTAVQWTRINTSGVFVEGGSIDDPTATATNGGKWYAYASIAVNKFDEIIVGFSQFSSSQHPAAGYVFRSRVLAAPMGDPFIFKAGEDYYHKTFGGGRNRWGDYGKSQVDPTDDTALWTMQEYAMLRTGTDDGDTGSNSSKWSTWWAKLALAPTAAPATISGSITTADDAPLAGVMVRLSGGTSATTITDSNGNYRFDNVDTDNFYVVTPSLVNYAFSPANRSFSLLGNKTDATFTGTAAAIVSANAIDSSEYFVRQQYLDFLGREPDQGGFAYWSDQINRCNSDSACIRSQRIGVSAAFFVESEFQQTGSFIYRLYRGALGRQVRFAEFVSDRRQLLSSSNLNANKAELVDAFVQRTEFAQTYQTNTTAASFVDALLQTVQRSARLDLSSERANLIAKYSTGTSLNQSRSLVVKDVAESAALAQAVYNKAFVLMQYFGYLQRDPDQGGYDFWLDVLNNREPDNYRSMVCSFLTSAEYQRRFGPLVTRTDAECSGIR